MENEWLIPLFDRRNSKMLNQFFDRLPHYPSQGVLTAGGSAFSYKGITIDLLGINNVQMAHAEKIKDRNLPKNHASFDKEVFYKQKPDLFWIGGGFVQNGIPDTIKFTNYWSGVFKNINRDEKFNSAYKDCLIIRTGESKSLHIFASVEFLNTLDTNFFKVIRYD